jgi:hypothetical protein
MQAGNSGSDFININALIEPKLDCSLQDLIYSGWKRLLIRSSLAHCLHASIRPTHSQCSEIMKI